MNTNLYFFRRVDKFCHHKYPSLPFSPILRGEYSDILIVHHGEITDTSYSNIVFDDGKRHITPAATLPNGTCRQRLLAKGIISEEHLSPKYLKRFRRAILINALIGLRENISLPISEIR